MERWRPRPSASPSTPTPGPSRGTPSVLSPPYRRNVFPGADVDDGQRSVELDKWWLARVEGNTHKIAVGGCYERNEAVREFTSAPVAKRYDSCTLETEDGIFVFINGFFSNERTIENGYTAKDCEEFRFGFPLKWEERNAQGCQPKYSASIDSRKDESDNDIHVPSVSTMKKDNLSALTSGWSKSSSVSTPESLKLKKTRSGRVVVPELDPGCQNIAYAPDGSISAIIGLDSPTPSKGSTSKKHARKKRKG